MKKEKMVIWAIIGGICMMLCGCGSNTVPSESTESADIISEEINNIEMDNMENSPEDEKLALSDSSEDGLVNEQSSEDKNRLSDFYFRYVMEAEDSIISEKGDILNVEVLYRDKYIHVLGGEVLYPELTDTLETVNELWKAELTQAEENGGETAVFVDIQRADAFALSFVRSVWITKGEENTVSYQGYHYDIETGETITLSDVITDTKEYAIALADKLQHQYPKLIDQDGLAEICETLLAQEELEWSIGYQGITFYYLEENENYTVFMPFSETEKYVIAECMQHPNTYAVSFESAVLSPNVGYPALLQWETCWDLDGDGTEENIFIEYEVGVIVGDYQVVIRVNDETYFFESNGAEVCAEGTPYLIFEEDRLTYVGLYMRGNLDGFGYIAMVEVSSDTIKPFCQEFLYLHYVRLTDPNHIFSCGMAWDNTEALIDGYFARIEELTSDGLISISDGQRYTFFPEEYVVTAKEVELPLIDPNTMGKTGELVVLEAGKELQLIWISWNEYLDCITPDGEIVRIEYSGIDESGKWILIDQEADELRDILTRD